MEQQEGRVALGGCERESGTERVGGMRERETEREKVEP